MKTAAFFAALAILASGADVSRADDYLSGYLDLGYTYQGVRLYDHGKLDLIQNLNAGTLGGAIQYRFDACAAGLSISESLNFEETDFGKNTYHSSGTNTAVGAMAGCRLDKLWIIGFGGSNAFAEPYRRDNYGIGLYYIFDEQYRIGFSAEEIYDHFPRVDKYFGASISEWAKYTIHAKYFLDDNLLLSTSLTYQPSNDSNSYGLFSGLEYKLQDRPVSFYAGLEAEYSRADEAEISAGALSATAGLRFFFNDGSLKTIVNNSMPDFRN
jgi:hypothetical protein